jgi:hypothetical protein
MILKLHGTSGSGKSAVARGLMSRSVVSVMPLGTGNKPEAYMVKLPNVGTNLYILGPYVSPCGGLDCISDAKEHIKLLDYYSEHGHVFYEGLLGSEYYGKIGQFSEKYGDEHIFAFLDTPIEVCIERIKARRLEAGNTKPLNEANTRGRVAKIERLRFRLENEFKRPTITIPYQDAIQTIHEIYKASE